MVDEFEPLIADRVFKYVYGTEKNKKVLMNLLSSCPFLKNYSFQSLKIQKQSLLETMSTKEKTVMQTLWCFCGMPLLISKLIVS